MESPYVLCMCVIAVYYDLFIIIVFRMETPYVQPIPSWDFHAAEAFGAAVSVEASALWGGSAL